jgi:hypothetical protein
MVFREARYSLHSPDSTSGVPGTISPEMMVFLSLSAIKSDSEVSSLASTLLFPSFTACQLH